MVIAFRHGFYEAWGKIYPSGEMSREWIGEMAIGGIAPPNVRLEVGVAGAIAEALLDGDESFREREFWDDWDPDEQGMSPSDWRDTGYDPVEEYVDERFLKAARIVGEYLKDNWSKVERIARELIAEERACPS